MFFVCSLLFFFNKETARSILANLSPKEDDKLDPDEIAKSYLEFQRQQRSSWSWEIELRPWVETF